MSRGEAVERIAMATASPRIPFTYRYGNVGWRSKLQSERRKERTRAKEGCIAKKRDKAEQEKTETERGLGRRERRKKGNAGGGRKRDIYKAGSTRLAKKGG